MGKCRECGREVSKSARVCPGCGVKTPIKPKVGCGAFLGGCVVVAIGIKVCSGGTTTTPEDPAAQALRDRSTECQSLTLEQMQLRSDVRSGGAHVADALVRLNMIEADAKKAGCKTLDADKITYLVNKHAAAQTPAGAASK